MWISAACLHASAFWWSRLLQWWRMMLYMLHVLYLIYTCVYINKYIYICIYIYYFVVGAGGNTMYRFLWIFLNENRVLITKTKTWRKGLKEMDAGRVCRKKLKEILKFRGTHPSPSRPSERRPWRISMKFNYAIKTLLKSTIWPHNFRWYFTKSLRSRCHSPCWNL